MFKGFLAMLLVCAPLCVAQSAPQATTPAAPAVKDCDDAKIHYSPVDSKYAARLHVEPTKETRPTGKPQSSPQRTRWLMVSSIDYSKPGPWTTTIWIGDNDDETSVKLILHDHDGFSIQWLNEKLIYGSVSWGKVLSTDFLFDVENQKFLYQEMENTAELSQDCQ